MISKNLFIWIARLEGLSLVLLFFVAMPLKYIWHMPELVRVVGSIHGALFIAYIIGILDLRKRQNWDTKTLALGIAASSVPFGTFWFETKVK